MEYRKPLPAITDENRQFWDAARACQLKMQKCVDCGHVRYPCSFICPQCLSERFEWERLSGDGEILSYVVFYQKYHDAFADDIPYNAALIQLKEGPRMFSNIVGVDNDVPKVGDRVEVVFDAVTAEIAIPRFRLKTGDSRTYWSSCKCLTKHLHLESPLSPRERGGGEG